MECSSVESSTTPAQLVTKVSHKSALSIGAAPNTALSAAECSGAISGAARGSALEMAPEVPEMTGAMESRAHAATTTEAQPKLQTVS